jgi:short-subunit dehydrogenase
MTKAALITGASSGIGYELAHEFAKHKTNVVITARNEAKLNALKVELKSAYNIEVEVIPLDLSIPNSAKHLFEATQGKGIHIDFLVNNAGFGEFGHFKDIPWSREAEMIQLNITTLTQLTKLYSQPMIERKGGRIMNVSSTAAFQPGPLMAVYYATKAFVLHFSEAVHNELKDHHISVTALCPGATDSGFEVAASLQESKLFKGRKLATSKSVAQYGYVAMMKGKPVAIHGFMNKVFAFSGRFAPRSVVTDFVRNLQEISK